jgi:cytochrome c nitrite reductase small subunit
MSRIDSLLARMAGPDDRSLLVTRPGWRSRLRLLARIGWRYLWVYASLLMLAVIWVAASGMDVYHRTEMPEFCGTCHEMGANFDTWARSRHGSIKCIDCHARPGVSGWVAAKMGGMSQLYTHLTASSIQDIHLQARHEAIVSENCERCHTETARAGDRRSQAMAHKRHGDLGLQCVACHSGNIAHPAEAQAHDPVAGLVDVGTCFKCHDGQRKVGTQVAFAATSQQSCEKCHLDAHYAAQHFAGDPSGKTHQPCLDCHEKQKSQAHFTMDRHDQGKLCARCHAPPKDLVSTHKPFREGKCDECHKVMAPAYLFGQGQKPDQEFCLHCHENVAAAIGPAKDATLTQFADGTTDLHKQHFGDIGKDDADLCIKCHGGHGSTAPRGLVRLAATKDGDGKLGVYTATKTGGHCTGACHDDDTVHYDRMGHKDAPTDQTED